MEATNTSLSLSCYSDPISIQMYISLYDTNTITPTVEEEDTTVTEVETTKEGVHTEVKPKRKVKRPTYLHDFV